MNWTDDKVLDFINWYLKVQRLGFRYTIENRTLIESFKRGDTPEMWHGNPLDDFLSKEKKKIF